MIQLTPTQSPLAQTRADRGVAVSRSRRRLSAYEQDELRDVLENKYECMHHPDFDEPDAEQRAFGEIDQVPLPDTSWYHPVMDKNWQESRHGSFKNEGSIVLTAAQEQTLFKAFNYCRFRVNEIKDRLLAQGETAGTLDAADAKDLLHWHFRAKAYREQIADTNLALVLAMAKRSRMTDADFTEMVSEGNMALLRAIEKFDAHRGFKFSTYACRAILKAFSRQGIKNAKHRQMFPTDFDPKLERSNWDQTRRADHEQDCVSELKNMLSANKADLSEMEVQVIKHRFALDRPADDEHRGRPLTLDQVGKRIGVTKERVRQIQNKALEKLREKLENDFLV